MSLSVTDKEMTTQKAKVLSPSLPPAPCESQETISFSAGRDSTHGICCVYFGP